MSPAVISKLLGPRFSPWDGLWGENFFRCRRLDSNQRPLRLASVLFGVLYQAELRLLLNPIIRRHRRHIFSAIRNRVAARRMAPSDNSRA